jgi:hypothetical protein
VAGALSLQGKLVLKFSGAQRMASAIASIIRDDAYRTGRAIS